MCEKLTPLHPMVKDSRYLRVFGQFRPKNLEASISSATLPGIRHRNHHCGYFHRKYGLA